MTASPPTDRRTPLTLLTGFLGSGKTTLLAAALAATKERIAVLVNEVADLPIDGALLEGYDEDVLTLPGGCVCCTLRGDLYDALARLRAHDPARIVLETTGLADPAPALGALAADERLAASVRLAGVVAVVDCERAERLLDTEPEAARQLELADRIALSKADLAPHRVDAVRERLAHEAPGRDVRVVGPSSVDLAWLFAPPFAGDTATRWLASSPRAVAEHGTYTAHGVRHGAPVDVDALQLWLRLVAQLDGERLLRVKAIARCAATGHDFVLQSAGRSVSPPQRLAAARPGAFGAEVVLIERGLPDAARRHLLATLGAALAGTAWSA